MTSLADLTDLQTDALREVSNIAAARAASALSELTGQTIMIGVPTLSITRVELLPELLAYGTRPIVCVSMQVLGDLAGRLLFLLPEESARRYAAALLPGHVSPDSEGALDELTTSCLMEAGNMLGGAYSSALATLTDFVVMISVPSLGVYPPDRVFSASWLGLESTAEPVLCMETAFQAADGEVPVTGHTVFVPLDNALLAILNSIGMG